MYCDNNKELGMIDFLHPRFKKAIGVIINKKYELYCMPCFVNKPEKCI